VVEPGALAASVGCAVTGFRPIGGGHGARHYRVQLADGRELFVKAAADGAGTDRTGLEGSAALAAEAAGLAWLSEAGSAPVAEIAAAGDGWLALAWISESGPDRAAAERFGRDLAALHRSGAQRFGAPWRGFIASLPLPNDQADSWPSWYADHRLFPYCRLARDNGTLGAADARLVESVAARIGDLAGPAEPPSRIHGDLWSGNLLWSDGRGWLIDPAAHGGHRETDLAMLALFGVPHLDRIIAAYQEVAPLAEGWRVRVPLHQLHPLLVHVCLFGAAYRDAAVSAARAALSS
jgi:fructosamine-3-kinase